LPGRKKTSRDVGPPPDPETLPEVARRATLAFEAVGLLREEEITELVARVVDLDKRLAAIEIRFGLVNGQG
jgi:hypothetical protein